MGTGNGARAGDGNHDIPYCGEAKVPPLGTPIAGSPKSSPKLRKVCSWCKAVIEPGDPGANTTHDMCVPCQGPVFREAGLEPPFPSDAHALAHTMGERFLSEDCTAFVRACGLMELPGGVA